MATFPTLRSGDVTMTPFTSSVESPTLVFRFRNDTEQRCAALPPRQAFVLTFSDLNGYDVSVLRAFWRSVKGAFDTTWSITIGGTTYLGCYFAEDSFIATEGKAERYTVSLRIEQV